MIDRVLLEKEALAEVCSCRYYDLAYMVYETPDDSLLAILNHTQKCSVCGN